MAARFSLFGPIAFYDVVRTARRGRYILVRYVYLCILLLLICFVNDPWHVPSRNAARLAEFATALFTTFLVTQLAAVVLLTPPYVATALTEEKEGKTLEFLLATDLLSREIVLGKLAARLGNLALLLLGGLPVLSLLELLGGIDPNLVLAGFAVTGLTMLGLGSVSLLCSVYCRRSVQALALVYLVLFIYLSLSAALWGAVMQGWLTPIPLVTGPNGLFDWVAAGNLPVLLVRLRMTWTGAGTQLGAFVLRYAVFQTVLAGFCVTWSVVRLRAIARLEASGPTRVERNEIARRVLPPLGPRPMLWKELYTPSTGRSSRTTRYLMGVLISIGIGFWLATVARHLMEIFGRGLDRFLLAAEMRESVQLPWSQFAEQMTWAVAAPAAGVAGTLFLGLAAHAAGTVTGERTRQTLEGLLTTPLPTKAILGDKVLGCLLGTRGAWWFLAAVLFLAYRAGVMEWYAVPWLLVATVLFALFATVLGLWLSTVSRSTNEATFRVTCVALFLTIVPVVAAGMLDSRFQNPRMQSRPSVNPAGLVVLVNPSGLLFFLASPQTRFFPGTTAPYWTVCAGVLSAYAVVTAALWGSACRRFRRQGRPLDDAPAKEGAPPEAPARKRLASSLARASDAEPNFSVGDVLILLWPAPLQRRRGWICLLVMTAVAWAGQFWLHAYLDGKLVAVRRDTDRRDPGWRWGELQAQRVSWSHGDNSARVVLSAVAKIRSGVERQPVNYPLSYELASLVNFALDPGSLRPIAAQLQSVSPDLRYTVSRLADAVETARTLTEYRWGRYEDSSPSPQQLGARGVLWLLRSDALVRLSEQDFAGALANCRAIVGLGRSVGDDPRPSFQLFRAECWGEVTQLAAYVLNLGKASEDELRALQQDLEREAALPLPLMLLRGERANCDRRCSEAEAGDLQIFRGPGAPPIARELDWAAAAALKQQHAYLLTVMTRYLEWLPLPLAEQSVARLRLAAERLPTGIASSRFERIRGSLLPGLARLRCAEVAVAAQRYYLRHDRLPGELGELVPEFLASVPRDPFSEGQPLWWGPSSGGFAVLSLGPSGTRPGTRVAFTYGAFTYGAFTYGIVLQGRKR